MLHTLKNETIPLLTKKIVGPKTLTMMSDDEIIPIVEESIQHFYAEDAWLLEHNLSERSIAHKLAEYIQIRISGYKVDCEYNGAAEDENSRKKIHLLADELERHGYLRETDTVDPDEEYVVRPVLPDIIIHTRGSNSENICVVEIKKSTSRVSPQYDCLKLEAYTSNKHGNTLCYDIGIFLVFEVGKTRKHMMTLFKSGKKVRG